MEEGICAETSSARWMNGGYSVPWMLSSCCAKFNFLFKVVLTSQQWHWRMGRLWLWWRQRTSRGWLGAGGMTQDLWVERAGGNRALVTGGTCRFPNGCNTMHVRSYAGFTWICLGFAPSVFAVPPVLARNELSWCSKTLNSPHLVFFSRKAAGQPCSPLPALLPRAAPLPFICLQGLGRCMSAESDSTGKQGECFPSRVFPQLLQRWRDVGCMVSAQIDATSAPGGYLMCDAAASLSEAAVPCLERAPGEDCTKCSDQNLQQCEATCVWVSLLTLVRFAKRICEALGCCSAPFQEKPTWFITWCR